LGTYYLPLEGSATFKSGDSLLTVERTSYLKLTVTDHPVYSVTPEHGPAGTVISVSGANFGTDPGPGNRSTATNHVTWANKWVPDANVLSWSNSTITFTPPDIPSLFLPQRFPLVGRISVTANGTASNDDFQFKIDSFIQSANTTRSGGVITVTLTGTSFGDDPGSLYRSTYFEHVAVDGTWIANGNVKGWSNSGITFTLPYTSTGGMVTVTSNGFESNSVSLDIAGSRIFLPLLIKN
jgi:hypothetical protein